jgi:hypothetical protein
MRGQERIKLKRETEAVRARKEASIINSVNQQNSKMNKDKSTQQSTPHQSGKK